MIETYYRILKHDSHGNLVKDTGLLPSHSYVIQFLEFILPKLAGIATPVLATDVTGAESNLLSGPWMYNLGRVRAPALDDTHGIVVGTGDTAVDNEDYKLDTKILHDAAGAANKMNYRNVSLVAPRVVGPNIDFDIQRAFLNQTGVTITVKEIGIICKNEDSTKYHLLLRDVVTDEDVLDAETLTVIYVLRTTA